MHIDFIETVKFEGKDYKSVDIPLEDLSGKELKNQIKAYKSLNGNNLLIKNQSNTQLVSDDDFLMFFISQICKMPIEFFEALKIPDYLGILMRIQTFFAQSLVRDS